MNKNKENKDLFRDTPVRYLGKGKALLLVIFALVCLIGVLLNSIQVCANMKCKVITILLLQLTQNAWNTTAYKNHECQFDLYSVKPNHPYPIIHLSYNHCASLNGNSQAYPDWRNKLLRHIKRSRQATISKF